MPKLKTRPATPKPMRLTERDKDVLQGIYEFEGLMSRRQLAVLYFNGNEEWAKKRLLVLWENSYLRRPTQAEIHRIPRGETVFWLDKRGVDVVAGLKGDAPLYTDAVKTEAPQWGKIEHELAINQVRLTILSALGQNPTLSLVEWVNEKTLTHWADTVTWTQINGRKKTQKFAFDGFLAVKRENPQSHKTETFAYLLEIDMATHSNPAFVDEKIRPGLVYLTSPVYEARFGIRYGRVLVVTTGGERLENMLRQTARVPGGEVFYFTTFGQLKPEAAFTQAIWRSSAKPEPFALIPS